MATLSQLERFAAIDYYEILEVGESDRETDRQTGRQIDRQTAGRQTDRQSEKYVFVLLPQQGR